MEQDYIEQLKEWERQVANPYIYDHLDELLPQFSFTMSRNVNGRTWVSPYKLDMSAPKTKTQRKTFCQERDLTFLREQGDWNNGEGHTVEVIRLIGEQLGTWNGGPYNTYKELSDRYLLNMPKSKGEGREQWKIQNRKESLLRDLMSYFQWNLHNTDKGKKVMDYLTTKRGFNEEFIDSVGFGAVPSWKTVESYMEKREFTPKELKEVCPVQDCVGDTHVLSIPYLCGGKVKGFLFRVIDHNGENKYSATIGMDRQSEFVFVSGLRNVSDLIVVEGELDSLTATFNGVKNVVSIGGSNIRKEQVVNVMKKNVNRITLCLDMDETKDGQLNREKRLKMVRSSVKTIQEVNPDFTQIYVTQLNEVIDPDEFIRNHGVGEFKNLIDIAVPYWKYYLQEFLVKTATQCEDNFLNLNDKQIQDMVEGFSSIESEIPSQRRGDVLRYRNEVHKVMNRFSLPFETYNEERERVEKEKEENIRKKGEEDYKMTLNTVMNELKRLIGENDFTGFRECWSKNSSFISDGRNFDTGLELMKVKTEEDIVEEETQIPESLHTGFKVGDNELLLLSGVNQMFVAPTNHGKTWFLLNLLLNVARKYPDKKFVFLSYEERENKIIEYLLNIYLGDLDIGRINPLTKKRKSNRRTLSEYYQQGQNEDLIDPKSLGQFRVRKETFFKEFIEKRRTQIKFVTYNSQQLVSAIRNLVKTEENIGCVFVDYIQLLNLPNKRNFNSRAEEMKEILNQLKDVAVETGLPLVYATQFNRTVVSPYTETTSNIGEAGDIERGAGQVFFLWNAQKPIIQGQKATEEEVRVNKYVTDTEKTIQEEDPSFHGMRIRIEKGRDVESSSDLNSNCEILRWRGNNQRLVPNIEDKDFLKKEWEVEQGTLDFTFPTVSGETRDNVMTEGGEDIEDLPF